MANSGFTRDEVILTLDALYRSKNGRLSPKSQEMKELSAMLKRLPIHSHEERQRITFRSPTGVSKQVGLFLSSCKSGDKNSNVGKMFFEVAFQFEGKEQELHLIAEAIRRNECCFDSEYGDDSEEIGFPEGRLLGHLHRKIEVEKSVNGNESCVICGIQPKMQYICGDKLLSKHLIVAPEQLDGTKKYNDDCFITVCPTCHSALHRYRPWCTDKNCEEILR